MIRAFLALPVPEDIIHRLSGVQSRLRLPRPVPRENFHITLAFLGKVPEPVLEELHFTLEALSLHPPLLRLDGLGVFGGDEPDALHARIAGDARLLSDQKKVTQAARALDIEIKARKFVPHITLGRFRRGEAQPQSLAAAMEGIGALTSEPWLAEEMVLYRSTLREEAPLYDVLARYPLAS